MNTNKQTFGELDAQYKELIQAVIDANSSILTAMDNAHVKSEKVEKLLKRLYKEVRNETFIYMLYSVDKNNVDIE